MTTAGRPTWDSAKGGQGKWQGDLSAMSKHYSVRDLPAHTKLKYRQEGQGRPEDIQGKDFKRELEDKERRLAQNKASRNANVPAIVAGDAVSSVDKRPLAGAGGDALIGGKRHRGQPPAGRPVPSAAAIAAVSTANLDADDPWEEDYDEGEPAGVLPPPNVDLDKDATEGNGGDDDDADNDDDDDEDEEALLAELAKIKRERAEEAARLTAEKKTAQETIRIDNILRGNPLLTNANNSEFKVKRRWDDDVVFKNCARGEVDHAKRGFVNDTLRSEFHKKFMKKYIQ